MSGNRITEMYAFVLIDDDNDEGIPAFMSGNGTWLPMVGADTARVESLMPEAQAMATAMNKSIEVIRFTVRERVMMVEP